MSFPIDPKRARINLSMTAIQNAHKVGLITSLYLYIPINRNFPFETNAEQKVKEIKEQPIAVNVYLTNIIYLRSVLISNTEMIMVGERDKG